MRLQAATNRMRCFLWNVSNEPRRAGRDKEEAMLEHNSVAGKRRPQMVSISKQPVQQQQ